MDKFKEDTRPYPVYRNDLKFKQLQNINPKRAIWMGDKVEQDFKTLDADSIDYRIKMCRQEKYDNIDLSRLNQKAIDDFFNSDFYRRHMKDILHIFMNNSNVHFIPNLANMTALETLDVSHNELLELPEVSSSLTELMANNNKIKALEINLDSILRINVSHNKITKLPNLKSAKTIYVSNNKISTMYCKYDCVKDMNCSDNPVSQLPEMINIRSLNCSRTKICQIFDYMNLINIISNDSNLSKLDRIPRLESLEIIRTKINKLKYFHNLKTLVFNKESNIEISDNYTVLSALKNKKNIFEVSFK